MENTNNLSLPYLMPSQAQKHVTHNEALKLLDSLVMLTCIDQTTAAPPSAPTEGDSYIIGEPATGIWQGLENQIANWVDGAWSYMEPKDGWLCWNQHEQNLKVYTQGNWETFENTPSSLEQISSIGINAAADEYNRLTIASSSTLFTDDGDSHRLVVNKNSTSDTASIVFQNNYSGRAEFGLTGNDDFSIKVSSNGSNFFEALKIDGTGIANFPTTQRVAFGNYQGSKDYKDKLYVSGANPGTRMEVVRPWGGFAADLFNIKAYKSSSAEQFSVGKIGFLGSFGANNEILGDVEVAAYLYFGANKNTSHTNNAFRIYPNNNVWCAADMSAGSFTDRTPYPESLKVAYECVASMQRLPDGLYEPDDKDQQLDHTELHPFILVKHANERPAETIEDYIVALDCDEEEAITALADGQIITLTETQISRDLSATVSAQNEVIKDLIKRISLLEKHE